MNSAARSFGLFYSVTFALYFIWKSAHFEFEYLHWGNRTMVAVATMVSMAAFNISFGHWGSSHEGSGRHPRQHGGDAVAASENLPQILTVPVRYCGPAFVSGLSMLWDTLTRNPELQWFGISPKFRFKVSRGDEGVGRVCFPGTRVSVSPDEGT